MSVSSKQHRTNGNGSEGVIRGSPLMEAVQRDAGYVFDRANPGALGRYVELLRSCEIKNLGVQLNDGYRDLGGKNVGLLLLQKALIDDIFGQYANLKMAIPETYMLGSSFFFTMLEANPELKRVLIQKYEKKGYDSEDFEEIKNAFVAAYVPRIIKDELIVFLHKSKDPFYMLRSSASCEDGILPSAGLFESLPFYNDRSRPIDERLENFEEVLKAVWASLYSPGAINMMMRNGLNPLSESMPITLQNVVGDWYGDSFFPYMSGVVKSTNNWPWDPEINRFDPVGRIGLGLGTLMVGDTGSFKEGGPRIFSFREDGDMLQFTGDAVDIDAQYGGGGHPITSNELRDDGQRYIDVLRVKDGKAIVATKELYFNDGRRDNLEGVGSKIPYDLRAVLASSRDFTDSYGRRTYVELYDALQMHLQIRRGAFFEIGKVIRRVMDELKKITGENVSMEFAVKPVKNEEGYSFIYYLLQVRPQTTSTDDKSISISEITDETRMLAKTDSSAFGHVETELSHIIVVTPEMIQNLGSKRIRQMLKENDERYKGEYLLIGPDAEAFISGSGGFESIYGGLCPGAVISLKSLAGIRNMAGDSGSHNADNIERAPVLIIEYSAVSPELKGLMERINEMQKQDKQEIAINQTIKIELDGTSGKGQIFFTG